MNYNKTSLIIFLGLILLIIGLMPVASAQSVFVADYQSIKPGIRPSEVALYNVTIKNLGFQDDVYSLSLKPSDSSQWISTPSSVSVAAESTKTFQVKLFPGEDIGLGTYWVELRVRARDQTEDKLILPVSISVDAYSFGYSPDVALNVVASDKQDPREMLKLEVFMRNRNQLDIENLVVDINSELFYKTYNVSIGPRKEKTQDVLLELNSLQKPGIYNYAIKITDPITGEVVSQVDKKLEVLGYTKIPIEKESSWNWFLKTENIVVSNEGNYEKTKEILVSAPFLKRIFMHSEPKGELVKTDDGTYLMWNPSIEPLGEETIVVYTNYRWLIIAVVLIIVILLTYYLTRSPVIILKESAVVKQDSEGVSEVKVRLFIKNRSRNPVHSISMTDKVPSIMEFSPLGVGSVKPSRMTKTTKKGTLLHWDIDRLESYEERIMTYRLKSKLKIVGDVTLPRLKARFETSRGREVTIISSAPMFIRN